MKASETKSKRELLAEERSLLRQELADLLAEGRDLDPSNLLLTESRVRSTIGRENYKKMESVIDNWLLRGEHKVLGIVLVISLFLRLQDDSARFDPVAISSGKSGNYSIINTFHILVEAKGGKYVLCSGDDYTETVFFTAARQNHGVIRDTISDVGLLKNCQSLADIDKDRDYHWIYRMYEDYYKDDISLAGDILLLFMNRLYSIAEKDRHKRKQAKKPARGYLDPAKIEEILLRFCENSKTNGRRLENTISILESTYAESILADKIIQSNPSSADGKSAADVSYRKAEKTGIFSYNTEVKDKDFSRKEYSDFLQKMIHFHKQEGFAFSRGLFVFAKAGDDDRKETARILEDVLAQSPFSFDEIDIKSLSFADYLAMRLPTLSQKDLASLRSSLERMSSAEECDLLEKYYQENA